MFSPDRSGWALYRESPDSRREVFLRLAVSRDRGRIVVRELLVRPPDGAVDSALLRALPLGRLTAALNRPSEYQVLAEWLPGVDSARPFPIALHDDNAMFWWVASPAPRAPRLKITVPPDRRKPDSFYEQVAERFTYLASRSERPAQELAEANEVPVTTIHGWVKEARRRGLLAAGERRSSTT